MKYSVEILREIYCSSRGDYFASVVIYGGNKRATRQVDFNGFRIMWHDKPFTYTGYPNYVRRVIADGLKRLYDNGELSVYEHDRYGNKRSNLRYHDPHRLQFQINNIYKQYGSGDENLYRKQPN